MEFAIGGKWKELKHLLMAAPSLMMLDGLEEGDIRTDENQMLITELAMYVVKKKRRAELFRQYKKLPN